MADDMQRDEEGAASLIAFMVAGVLFMSVIGVVLLAGDQATRPVQDENQSAAQVVSANSLAAVLMGSAGYYEDPTLGVKLNWSLAPDQIHRMGLLDEAGARIDFTKLQNLRFAPLAVDPADNYLNYGEARRSLGLDDAGMDFHIRAFPSLKNVQDILECRVANPGDPAPCGDPNMKVTYIGHQEADNDEDEEVDPAAGLTASTPSCVAETGAGTGQDEWLLRTTLTNNGQAETIFQVVFRAVLNGVSIEQTSNSFLVPVTTSRVVELEVPNTAAVACTEHSTIEVEVWGPSNILLTETTTLASTVAPAPANPSPILLFSKPSKSFYADGEDVVIGYDGGLKKDDWVFLVIYPDDDGTPDTSTIIHSEKMKVKQSVNQWRFPDIDSTTFDGHGTKFWAYVTDGEDLDDGEVLVGDRFSILASPPSDYVPTGGPISFSASSSVGIETEFLDILVQKFCPRDFDEDSVHARCASFKTDAVGQNGDIFYDEKKAIDEHLLKRIWDGAAGVPRYDVTNTIVVGSNVKHNSLTSGTVKWPLHDWVLGGGTLIVLGHEEKNVQWLMPIFHSGIDTSSGPIAIPDESHPVLIVPNRLDTPSYDNDEKTWRFNSGHGDFFTHVAKQDDETVLGVSNPGAFGKGDVLLTSWKPYDLFKTGPSPNPGDPEAMALLQNLLSQGYKDLFLDYGPPLPTQGGSAPSWRISTVDHPDLGPVELTVQFWVF